MSLTTSSYFLFLLVALILYYVAGKKLQKYILLGAGIFFYLQVVSIDKTKVALVLAYVIAVTYLGARIIDRCTGKVRTFVAVLSVGGLVGSLFVLKYAYNMVSLVLSIFRVNSDFSWLQFAAVMGISYFSLSAIGYLLDVYWGSYKAEKHIGLVALFVTYFPQLVSGPVTRFPQMREQFVAEHKLDCEMLVNGMRRMAWGYFKKLVLSERFAIIVSTVYGNVGEYSGMQILFATFCYILRLYTDFSGCMDIIMGTSQLFGIALPENFKAPFLSRTIQEFWQRWHITLGGWFKDYVMYPVQISGPFVKLAKKCKKRFGKNVGKKIPTYCAMLILWFFIGVWHGGTLQYFVASAMVPFFYLIAGDLLQPLFKFLVQKLPVNTEHPFYQLWQRVRTTLLLFGCWVFVCTATVGQGFRVLVDMAGRFRMADAPELTLSLLHMEVSDVVLMVLGVLLLLLEQYWVEKHGTVMAAVDRRPPALKYLLIYAEVLLLFFYGMVGSSSFIYFNF